MKIRRWIAAAAVCLIVLWAAGSAYQELDAASGKIDNVYNVEHYAYRTTHRLHKNTIP